MKVRIPLGYINEYFSSQNFLDRLLGPTQSQIQTALEFRSWGLNRPQVHGIAIWCGHATAMPWFCGYLCTRKLASLPVNTVVRSIECTSSNTETCVSIPVGTSGCECRPG